MNWLIVLNTNHNVVHVVPTLNPQAGGPSRTVTQLADSLATSGLLNVSLLTQQYTQDVSVASRCDWVERYVEPANSKLILYSGFPVRNGMSHIIKNNKPSIVHAHGLWLPANHWPVALARKFGIPYVMQPRGMLEPWAMEHKSWKKKVAMSFFQRRDLESAKMVVATSKEEYQNIRKLGFTNPIAVIPNGIEFHESKGEFKDTKENSNKNVLFLSRIHPKKGLINLVQAWATVKPREWRLQLAGPDEGGHLTQVMTEAKRYGIQDCIDYLGDVDGAEKAAVYQNADLFVLPTFSENFGVVVAEALSYGLPVITTKGAPWADLPEHRCGWWIDIGVEPLVTALCHAMTLSDAERYAMGERGKAYVKRYDWQDIAQQTEAMYAWVLGQGNKPDFIYLD
ncbi:glycosyltransferase [Halomonas sp. 18H]|nr:glycosyltransferase [Halomonas sp. 18H]MCW4153903.1 glycosyltransferase [Halomonas sp. 18H]